jgi:hypothetical protein
MPEENSEDGLPEQSVAVESHSFLETNRAHRESWLQAQAKANDEIKQILAKGVSNEVIVRQMLRKFLPPKYGIVEGFLYDCKGVQSKQTDVIIYDRFALPNVTFEADAEESNKFIPIDSVAATIEVKTTLKGKVGDAFDNIRSTRRSLEPIGSLVSPAGSSEMWYRGHPTSFIFAFKGGWVKTSSIRDAVRNEILKQQIQPKCRFDMVYVYDEDVTIGWVFSGEKQYRLIRPCDHWDKPLHLTEIVSVRQPGDERPGLLHFLSQVVLFVTRFSVPSPDRFLYHYRLLVRMKYNTADDSIPAFMDES